MNWTSDKNPNPQGKGLVSVVADWEGSRPAMVSRKDPAELLFDWFVSALILSSRFQLKPAVGQDYFLYVQAGDWHMSLVAPHEWGERQVGDCLGRCTLRDDMTWAIEPVPDLASKPDLLASLSALAAGFMRDMDSDDALVDKLPGYRREMPYYQRMLATGLGASLRESAAGSGMLSAPVRDLLLEAGDSLPKRLLGSSD